MQLDDMILVSVDDHVVEPPDLFAHHLTAAWKARAPRVVRKKDGTDVWVFEGQQIPNIGLNAVVGRPPEEYGVEPTSFDQLRPGTYERARAHPRHERERRARVDVLPVVPRLLRRALVAHQGQGRLADDAARLQRLAHRRVVRRVSRAASSRSRCRRSGIRKLMADEVRRVAQKGCHAITFSENPEKLGLPSLHAEHWDPFWSACSDEGTIVCIHIGSGAGMTFTSMDAPVDVMITVQPIHIVDCAADLLWSRVLRKFPQLQIALSEGGIGWIPYFLERADYVYQHHRAWTHQDFGGKLPSDVFREQIVTCFIDDPIGVANRHAVGIDTITWECDYPHSDTTWPHSPELLAAQLAGVPDAEVNQITHENALRHFRLDPFAHIPKERCRVGALRAQARDVDLSVASKGGKPPSTDAREARHVAGRRAPARVAFATAAE